MVYMIRAPDQNPAGRYIRSGMEPERMDLIRTGKGDSRAAAERARGMESALFVRVPAENTKEQQKNVKLRFWKQNIWHFLHRQLRHCRYL